jgi:hypothetical protein
MQQWRMLLVAATVAVPSVASAQNVNTMAAPGTDFSKYRTYVVLEGKQKPQNPMAAQIIESGIDKWLGSKGWQKVDQSQADVAVVYNVATERGQTLNTFYDGWGGGGWGYGWGGMGMGSSTTTVSTYTEGTLVVDMFDAKSKQAFWRGVGTDTLSDDPEKNVKKVNKALEKMFKKNFPPQPKT